MTDKPRDGDAERIQAARDWIATYAKHIGGDPDTGENDWCGWVCALLRALDASNAALREKDAEIRKLRHLLQEAAHERDKWFGIASDEQVANQCREKQITEAREEIVGLRSTPIARVVKAARELKFRLHPTHGSGFVWILVEGDPGKLSTVIADYDASVGSMR